MNFHELIEKAKRAPVVSFLFLRMYFFKMQLPLDIHTYIHNLYLTWEKHLAIAILQVFHKLTLRKKERNMYIEM